MKKAGAWVIGTLALIGLMVGGFLYQKAYGGDDYYTQVPAKYGYIAESKDDSGKVEKGIHGYKYVFEGYNKDGKKTVQKSTEWRNRPLKNKAYLKLTVNKVKGITSWEQVSKTDVPKKALNKIESNESAE